MCSIPNIHVPVLFFYPCLQEKFYSFLVFQFGQRASWPTWTSWSCWWSTKPTFRSPTSTVAPVSSTGTVTVCLAQFLALIPSLFPFRKFFYLFKGNHMGIFSLILIVLFRIRTGFRFNSVSGSGSGSILSVDPDPDQLLRSSLFLLKKAHVLCL